MMSEQDHDDVDGQFSDRLVDMMLEEGIGDRTPPDLGDSITRAVTRRRQLERLPIALAIAATIAAIIAHFVPRLLTPEKQPSPDDIAQQKPTPSALVQPGGRSSAEPFAPTPPVPTPPAPVSREYITEAKRWPPSAPKVERKEPAKAIEFPAEQWKKLPAFEAHRLAKADQVFAAGKYRAAIAACDAFLMEYPRSTAVPYVLLRKGRALHLDQKRFQAIKTYREVLDYFPNAIGAAAPALFYIGDCHRENGDAAKAMKAWLEMATDNNYKKHNLAAYAINRLADNLWRQAKLAEALKHYGQVAKEFRHAVPDAGLHAVLQVARYHILIEPDEAKLREWYREADTFNVRAHKLVADTDLSQDIRYWAKVLELVREGAAFYPESQRHMKRQCLDYWIAVFDSRVPRHERLLIALADLRRSHTGDGTAWVREMDAIFNAGYKPGDIGRVLRWLEYYRGLPDQAARYCAMISPTGKGVGALNDDGKAKIALRLGVHDADAAKRIIAGIADDGLRLKALVDYYHGLGPDAGKEELPVNLDTVALSRERMQAATDLAKVEKHAKLALWAKARFLHWDKRYKEAIAAYKACDNPPDNLWPIIECQAALGNWQHAVQELVEMENFFENEAARAALMRAEIYGRVGRKKEQIVTLRSILKTYRASPEARMAHRQLERMGVVIGGGLEADQAVKEKENE